MLFPDLPLDNKVIKSQDGTYKVLKITIKLH